MMQNSMRIIGLTGGIASGKSTVAAILAKHGAYIIDADKIGHKIYYKGGPAWRGVIDAFGDEILDNGGNIDRAKLGQIVFSDNKKLQQLNAIVHPLMRREIQLQLKDADNRGFAIAVIDAAVLIESGWYTLADEIWLVVADNELRLQRLMQRNGFSRQQAWQRIESQMPDDEKAKYADVIIDNNGDMEELENKVIKALYRKEGL